MGTSQIKRKKARNPLFSVSHIKLLTLTYLVFYSLEITSFSRKHKLYKNTDQDKHDNISYTILKTQNTKTPYKG